MIGHLAAVAALAAVGPTSAPLAPTPVEIRAADAPLAEVLGELEKQAGFSVRVADSPDAGNRKITVDTRGKVPFWTAAEAVAAAAGMRADAAPFAGPTWGAFTTDLPRDRLRTPAPNLGVPELANLLAATAETETGLGKRHGGAVVFRPGKPAPFSVNEAVRVRVVPLPALPAVPKGTVPVVMHVASEPNRAWKSVTGLAVTEATDARGRELAADPVDGPVYLRPVEVEEGAVATLAGKTDDGEVRRPEFLTPTHALVRLAVPADGPPPTRLATLKGEIRGTAWTADEDLASVTVEKTGKAVRADGQHGVALEVLRTDPADSRDGYGLIAVLGYHPGRIRPPGTTPWPALEPGDDGTREPDGVGIEHAERIDPNDPPIPVRMVCGLSAADADGNPFDLTLVSNKRRLVAEGGRLTHTHIVEVTLTPTNGGTKPPASVRFRGSRAVPVRVPFAFTDIPVAAGARK